MKFIITTLVAILISILAFAAYVRLAPSDPDRLHLDPLAAYQAGRVGAFDKMAGELYDLDEIIRTTPGVSLLAGAVSDGHITYIARSRFWGFPDYITVKQVGSELMVYSRQRFGTSDLGVNAQRLRRWSKALGLSKNLARL